MADTNYVDFSQPTVNASWLNDVNKAVYRAIGTGAGGTAPATPAEVLANLGLNGSSGSALVGFLQAGSGAQPRTVQSRLRDTVSVKDFGAVGDGVADDTVAIQAAFNTIGVTSNGVLFPYGTYKVSDTIAVSSKSGFTVSGYGQISQITANKPIFQLTSCTDFQINGLSLYGLGTDYVGGSDTSLGIGIYLQTCSRFTIKDNTFRNFGYAGVMSYGGCSQFNIRGNTIIGTSGITSTINAGDFYQFGVICKSGTSLASPNAYFDISENKITNVAIGVRTEPNSHDFTCTSNKIYNILGVHGFYLNGYNFTISNNELQNISATTGVGIKLQHFQNTGLGVNQPVTNATVSGNTINVCLTGISCEKTSSAASDGYYVNITGNNVYGAGNGGYGIYVEDTTGLVVADNQVYGGAYGIAANVVTSGRGCQGRISGNYVSDTRWSGIFGYAQGYLSITENDIVRPCLAAIAADPQQDAIFVNASSTTHRAKVSGNTVLVSTSTGVNAGLSINNVDCWIGDNDLDSKPITTSGMTIRKRTAFGDYAGLSLWSGIGTVATGATASKAITVTGAALADQVVSLSLASDLQGCTLSGYITANTLNVVITNNTGSSKTIADAFVRYAIMKYAA